MCAAVFLIEQIEGMEAPAQIVNEMGPDEHAEIENPKKTFFFFAMLQANY